MFTQQDSTTPGDTDAKNVHGDAFPSGTVVYQVEFGIVERVSHRLPQSAGYGAVRRIMIEN